MSLINDALQELDRRNGIQDEIGIADTQTLMGEAKIGEAKKNNATIYAWAVVVAISICTIGFWFSLDNKPQEHVIAQTHTSENDKNEAEIVAVNDVIPSPVVIVEEQVPVIQADVLPPPENEIDDLVVDKKLYRLDRLINAAEDAFNNNRLTLPLGKSAYDYYQQALIVEPDNKQALLGVENVKAEYVQLFEKALIDKNDNKAATYVKRLELLLTKNELPEYRKRLQYIVSNVGLAIDNSTDDEVDDIANNSTTYSIKKSAQQEKENFTRRIRTLFLENKWQEVIDVLQLKKQQGDVLSRESMAALLESYMALSRYSEAMALLVSQENSGDSFPYYRAMLLRATVDDVAAYAYLDKQQGLTGQSLAMYAGYLQKDKRFDAATKAYRLLLRENDKNSIYWLGLAVSSDSIGYKNDAYTAYEVAHALGGHSVVVNTFISQRLSVLKNEMNKKLELTQW